jgi:hypothetical protein
MLEKRRPMASAAPISSRRPVARILAQGLRTSCHRAALATEVGDEAVDLVGLARPRRERKGFFNTYSFLFLFFCFQLL